MAPKRHSAGLVVQEFDETESALCSFALKLSSPVSSTPWQRLGSWSVLMNTALRALDQRLEERVSELEVAVLKPSRRRG